MNQSQTVPLLATAILLSSFMFTPLSAQEAEDWGSISLNSRLRYETAEQTGKEDADNTSLRTRLGYITPGFSGFKAMVEGEFTFVADEDSFNAAGVSGDPDKAVIADPESTQLDQAWLGYSTEGFSAKVGRQVIALDGQRWVGHVGWRQNRQTFDAATLGYKMGDVNLTYGYIDNVVRIFGSEAPDAPAGNASEFDAENHILNASYNAGDMGKFTAYGYFLDMDAPGKIAGSDTIGISYDGSVPVGEGSAGVYLEYASQSDAAGNVQDYTADYLHGVLKGGIKGLSLELGYELLGSDDAGLDADGNQTFASVKSPLATLHKFNGFADVFLATPDKGLEDVYAMAGYKFDLGPDLGPLVTKLWYHDFSSDEGSDDLGSEIDAVVVKPLPLKGLPGSLSFLFKYADYDAPTGGNDLTRTSAELNYAISF